MKVLFPVVIVLVGLILSCGGDQFGLKSEQDPVVKDFEGCISATNSSERQIRVDFDYPEHAKEVRVYRDGNRVFSSTSSEVSTFFDVNIEEGSEYEYACEVIFTDNETTLSPNVISVTARDPLSQDFAGCTSGEALHSSSVSVAFDFPDGADKVTVSRDGVPVLVAVSAAESPFTDTGLAEETEYSYTCEVQVGDRSKTGEQRVDITTPSNIPPTIAITSPGSVLEVVNQGSTFDIKWTDSDPDQNATITLRYDSTDVGACDGPLIFSGIKEDDLADSYGWDTTGIALGVYYICAVIDDGFSTDEVWSVSTLTIQ